jgi:hypothetical protein
VAPTFLWKLALAIVLACAIIASASAKAPRKPLPRGDLRWLLLGALTLYVVGFVALLKHHGQLEILLFAAGIVTSTLAAWLSRGSDSGSNPPRGEDPFDDPTPPDGDGAPRFDWAQFERDLSAYSARLRDSVHSR